ncbi:MAG: sulfotransferase domain-containing protein [Anaerolineales bacterium]|jgi:hypothetical protein
MRIIVASPPKTGNIWVKSILSEVYNLRVLTPEPGDDVRDLETFVEQGSFVDDAIFHQHYWPTNRLFKLTNSLAIYVVTILRNPYDTFVSLFYYVQNFPEIIGPGHPLHFIHGKSIDHPEVLDFIKRVEGGFGIHLVLANKWLKDGRSILIRFEALKSDTYQTVKSITDQIQPVTDAVIHQALEETSAKRMREKSNILSRHIRKASVGDWRNHLTQAHLNVFKTYHGDLIENLGYEVA